MNWLLHGAVGMAADWELPDAGAEARPVELWDYLAEGGLSMDAFGGKLAAEAAKAGPFPVLTGYSLGGRLALHSLLAAPAVWKAAVIVSAHPGLRDERSRLERMADDAEWAAKALTADWRKFLAEWEGREIFARAEGALEWPDRAVLEGKRHAVARGFMEWSLGKQEDLRSRLGEIACPVLWITGERDEKFTALAREAVGLLPQGRHEVVAGAGHRVPWENPDRFQKLVKEFLDSVREQ